MPISAKVILDSISPDGVRLTTLELCYPRFIHAEFMTHRVFSRNASSSRAIPVKKMLENIRNEPAMPIHWGQNQPGMQADQEIANPEVAKQLWIEACEQACAMAERMLDLNIHKQVVNRITEPFAHIRVLVTATEWENFFILRDHKDAQPEIHELAIQMKVALGASAPTLIPQGGWHLPFVREDELHLPTATLLKISTARCARVSYLTHDGQAPTIEKDIALYDKLITSKPAHASPTEHQAQPNLEWTQNAVLNPVTNQYETVKVQPWSGNFYGWRQHRKLIEHNFR